MARSEVLHYLRTAIHQEGEAEVTDGQLLGRFVTDRDESAFACLVRRHGPMVWAVCRRVLRHEQDAEDAFQATFLVLARKAASVRPRGMVANWLYGTARRTALKGWVAATRRATHERQVSVLPEPAAEVQVLWDDWKPFLDRELSLLPDRYRAAVVFCDLSGRTRKEAARHFGVPEGTVVGWLTRGRALLAKRLVRRGFAITSGSLAAGLAQQAASASVPVTVVLGTIQVVRSGAAGQAAGVLSARVAGLAEGVVRAMLLTKLKQVAAVLAVLATVALGFGVLGGSRSAGKPATRAEHSTGGAENSSAPVPAEKIPPVEWHEKHKEPKVSDLQVDVVPASKVIRTSTGLLLPVKITNHSSRDILVKLAHEKGTVWPSIYASVTPEQAASAKPFRPIFLFGQAPDKARDEATIPKGKSLDLELRMDLAADSTGFVNPPLEPLLPGTYKLRLLLVFEAGGTLQYVASAAKTVELMAAPKEVVNGLSARVVIKSPLPLQVIPGETDTFQAELVLTNDSDKPLRLCRLCGMGGSSWRGGYETGFAPDVWKSDAPPSEESARHLFVLNPAESVSFPFRGVGVRAIDEKFRVRAGYGIGEAFGTKHNTWVGNVRAAVVIPVAETKRHVTEDEKKLQGTWRVTRLELDGITYGPESEKVKDARVIIEQNQLTEVDAHRRNPMIFKLDPTAKPKTILFKTTSIRGIYELDGDDLRLCLVRDEDDRPPTDFTANTGSNRWLYFLKRE